MDQHKTSDMRWMRRCFALARRGAGRVSPNPLVGAVIVKNNQVIGEGWHEHYGQAHAEVNAIENAGGRCRGATLYVNLEPCCHRRKLTPPCTPLIIRHKIKRVVIANEDANPMVNGKGIAELKAAGIQVTQGILAGQGYELNRFYFKYITTAMPYVIVKIAQSMDGKITRQKGQPTAITSERSNRFVHQLRATCDAVLVGAGTIQTDDPQLTVRYSRGRNPHRVIIDGNLSTAPSARIFERNGDNQVILFCAESVNPRKMRMLQERGVQVEPLPVQAPGVFDLVEVLQRLGQKKITSLFVEGGQRIFSQFIGQELFDEIILLQAAHFFGRGVESCKTELIDKLIVHSLSMLGGDVRMVLKKIGLKNKDEMKRLNN